MFTFDKNKLIEYTKKLSEVSVLVIGDIAIDEMIYGNTERISREAPVLILEHDHTNIILGGGANAANNISSLNNGKVSVVGLCGNDYHKDILLNALSENNINSKYIVEDKSRYTTVKTRISGSCSHSVTQQIVRIDRQTKKYVTGEIENQLIENIKRAIPEHDAVILSDYNIGTLSDRVIKAAIDCAKEYNKVIVVDAQKDLQKFQGVTALTPNQPDSEKAVGYFIKDEDSLKSAGNDLLKLTNAKMMLITRGGEGMCLFKRENDEKFEVPALNKTEVFDVTGAGDTVVAAFTLALASGSTPEYASIIGDIAASIVIRKYGCAVTTVKELIDKIEDTNFKF